MLIYHLLLCLTYTDENKDPEFRFMPRGPTLCRIHQMKYNLPLEFAYVSIETQSIHPQKNDIISA